MIMNNKLCQYLFKLKKTLLLQSLETSSFTMQTYGVPKKKFGHVIFILQKLKLIKLFQYLFKLNKFLF